MRAPCQSGAHARVFDADSISKLAFLPRSVVIVGLGIVACEFAKIFAKLGADVTMLVRGEPFLHAKSTIYLTDPAWEEMVERRGTPLGAVFRVMGARAANIFAGWLTLLGVGRGGAYGCRRSGLARSEDGRDNRRPRS